jgi:GTP-binding protein EngB required for normal cell division
VNPLVGWPSQIENTIIEEYPVLLTKQSIIKLTSADQNHSSADLALIEKEFQICQEATLEYEIFSNKLDKISSNVQLLIENAKNILVTAKNNLQLDLTKSILDGFIKTHEDNIDHMKWDFAEIIETKNMELAPWQLFCFEDKEKIIRSQDLLGKLIHLLNI